jgi:cobaltochelatase CobN
VPASGLDRPSLRLVNLLQLKHPMSVDTWVERTGKHAKLIVIRILGGAGYWPYGLEAIHAAAVEHGIRLVVLPGDDKADPGLARFCTIPSETCETLWRFLIEGGAENARGFLDACGDILAGRSIEGEAAPLLKAGVFGAPMTGEAGTVAIVFYRALVQSGQTAPIEALTRALGAHGLAVLPVYVSSLKDPVSAATVEALFSQHRPDVVLNATGFAVSAPGADRTPTVLERDGAPVIQVVLSGSPKEVWEASLQGLNARDLAMNVALPEVDGRVLSRAVSFKSASAWDTATECNIVMHEPVADRVAFVAELAARWVRLRRKPASEKHVAIVLANYPNRDGRLANGVGLDTPAGTIEVLMAMAEAGLPAGEIPVDGDALIDHLREGPTNAVSDAREVRETISLSQYKDFFVRLPKAIQAQATERWGGPERDPFFRDGVFALPLARFGETLVGIQPARGYNIDPKETYHSPDLVPPHGYLAFYAYLRDVYRADAVVHMGKHGNLEWLPGKALALSETCWPEAVFGPLPHVYPFIVNDPGEGTQAKRRTSAVIIDHLTPPLTRAESYGPLKDLEALVDEYYEAAGGDPRRLKVLKVRILDLVRDIGLDQDAGIAESDETDAALEKLDAYLCDLKEMQIRDGLHIFGRAPEGRLADRSGDCAGARAARAGRGGGSEPAAGDCRRFGIGFRPARLRDGRGVGRGETRYCRLLWTIRGGPRAIRWSGSSCWRRSWSVARTPARRLGANEDRAQRDRQRLRPSVEACGAKEIDGLLAALSAGSWSPGRRARRRGGGQTCCRRGAISIPSTAAPCRRRRPGNWAGNPPNCW